MECLIEMDRYKYVPMCIFEIYVGILKRGYRVEQRKSLLSEGSYIIDLYQDYPGVTTSYQRHIAVLRPVSDKLTRF